MLRSISVTICIFLLFSNDIISQNLFADPGFGEPVPKPNSITECGGYKGETFDDASLIWSRSNHGTPDIVLPRKQDCPRHMDKAFFTSQCLGMYFGLNKNYENGLYTEPVETKLVSQLLANQSYELSFDILFNKNLYYLEPEVDSYKTTFINVILKSQNLNHSDTLVVPVSERSHKEWARCNIVFDVSKPYEIIQFDYDSKLFPSGENRKFIYAYLDNFNLSETNKQPTKFTSIDKEYVSELESAPFSYYFESDNDKLDPEKLEKLKMDIQSVLLQKIENITVTGYTDNTHNRDYNDKLSKKRAENILLELKLLLPDQDINYDSKGMGVDENQKDKAMSRRVDVTISYEDSEVAPWYKTSNNDQYFTNYSYLGNLRLAQEKNKVSESKFFPSGNKPKFENVPFDADRLILAKAKKAKILIINEDHTAPSHRAYIANLLPKLKKIGYTKIGVEALQTSDDVHSLTIKDPTFLRYLLEAKQQGYELISYDNKSKYEPNWETEVKPMEGVEFSVGFEDMERGMNIRDYNQFLNLESKIDQLAENEKIIIHVGHGHGTIMQVGGWKPLGVYLIEKYGRSSVLSIDQVSLNNCISIDSNDYYNQYRPKKSIMCNVGGKPFVESDFNILTYQYEKMYDSQVLHHSNDFRLVSDTSFIYVKHLELEGAKYPLAIMIYQSEDNPVSDIAYSAIEVKHKEDWKPSIIPNNGKYKLLVKDSSNNVLAYNVVNQ